MYRAVSESTPMELDATNKQRHRPSSSYNSRTHVDPDVTNPIRDPVLVHPPDPINHLILTNPDSAVDIFKAMALVREYLSTPMIGIEANILHL